MGVFPIGKIETDSVKQADSEDFGPIIGLQFPENSISFFFSNFWNCVGGNDLRGCFTSEITQCVDLITVVIPYI